MVAGILVGIVLLFWSDVSVKLFLILVGVWLAIQGLSLVWSAMTDPDGIMDIKVRETIKEGTSVYAANNSRATLRMPVVEKSNREISSASCSSQSKLTKCPSTNR